MSEFTIHKLPLSETGSFEKTIISYLNGHETLKKLYDFESSSDGFRKRIAKGSQENVDRDLLARILHKQYSSAGIVPENILKSNIDSLNYANTFTVTTGHQLNIFSGPLYVIFKLISTINLAEQLKQKFPDVNVVPVYWMASEDHDIAEINNLSLFSKQYLFESTYAGKSGKMKLDGFDKFVESVEEVFGKSEYANELSDLIRSSYLSSSDLATATRKWIHSLLGKYGLIILDADDADLKKKFIPVIKKELSEEFTFSNVNKAISVLGNEFIPQVNPREINLFFLDGNLRNRIVRNENKFNVLNSERSFSKEEFMNELETHPEKFSPNVLLRPVYQEIILPNIAYVGGPSEIAYWLELKFVFDTLGLTMPVLMLRNCAMIIDKAVLLKWQKLGFEIADIFKPENELSRLYLEKKDLNELDLNFSTAKINEAFDELSNAVSNVDQSLKATVDSERQKSLNSLKLLEEKVMRSLRKKEETELLQIKKVKEKIMPSGNLQERTETLIPFYLKWSNSFIDQLKKTFDPFDNNFIIFEEK